jgi:hypothetical protein
LASDRLCASLRVSSRRCLLQERRSYIASMLFFSPLGSALPFALPRRLPSRGQRIGHALARYAETTLYGTRGPKVNWSAGAPTVLRTLAYKRNRLRSKDLLLWIKCFGAAV